MRQARSLLRCSQLPPKNEPPGSLLAWLPLLLRQEPKAGSLVALYVAGSPIGLGKVAYRNSLFPGRMGLLFLADPLREAEAFSHRRSISKGPGRTSSLSSSKCSRLLTSGPMRAFDRTRGEPALNVTHSSR